MNMITANTFEKPLGFQICPLNGLRHKTGAIKLKIAQYAIATKFEYIQHPKKREYNRNDIIKHFLFIPLFIYESLPYIRMISCIEVSIQSINFTVCIFPWLTML